MNTKFSWILSDEERDQLWISIVKKYPAVAFYKFAQEHFQLFQPTILVNDHRIHISHPVRVDSFVKLEGGEGMFIGAHVHIASFCHLGIGGGLTLLEDGTSFGSGAKVLSGSNVPGLGHGCSAIAPDAEFKRSFVHIRRNATIYAGAMVLPGVTVGENAIVAAGAVVTKDVAPFTKVAGVPARFMGNV